MANVNEKYSYNFIIHLLFTNKNPDYFSFSLKSIILSNKLNVYLFVINFKIIEDFIYENEQTNTSDN